MGAGGGGVDKAGDGIRGGARRAGISGSGVVGAVRAQEPPHRAISPQGGRGSAPFGSKKPARQAA